LKGRGGGKESKNTPSINCCLRPALYSTAVIGTLAVDGWAVTFGVARRGLGGLQPAAPPSPFSLYQM